VTDLDLYDEQFVLACLLKKPDANRWELDGLSADLFENPVHREIAEALIVVRNSGRFIHWRRVRGELRKRDRMEAFRFVRRMVNRNGLHWGLTAAMSRVIYRHANRRAA
jgi:replicative DNA helicase